MHCYDQYQAHHWSLEREGELDRQYAHVKLKLAAQGVSHMQRNALIEAITVLRKCWRALKYTYPFAFYLERTNQADIFDENQASLETATNALVTWLDQRTDDEEQDTRILMDKTRFCDRRRKALLEHCREG